MKKSVNPTLFKMTRKVAAERRDRVIAIVESLTEAGVVAAGNHLSLEVRQKRFGWYLDDHHGDGRLAINCKAPRDVAEQLANHASDRFHIPKYVSHLGWVGLWLDTPQVDWAEVEAILAGAYRLTAPKKLTAELDSRQNA
jgi:YjbR protein